MPPKSPKPGDTFFEHEERANSEHCEIRPHYVTARTFSKQTRLTDPCFMGKFAFSPYKGCAHGCIYCDGRAERYYIDGDFERDIEVRRGMHILLDRELRKAREKGTVLIGSGVSDPYQPIEEKELIMRRSAEILIKYSMPATILTKSALALRDLDLWKELNEKAGLTLMVSLTTLDDNVRQIFEPRASSVNERIEMLMRFIRAGIPTGILAMPFLPLISDSKESIAALAAKMSEIGIDFAIPGTLTLRPGRQKSIYLKKIREEYPNELSNYINLYANELESGAGDKSYIEKTFMLANDVFDKNDIPTDQPHQIYFDRFPIYDEVFILMNHMLSLYKKKGHDITPLKIALRRYTNWLKNEKKTFAKNRNLTYRHIERKVFQLSESNEMETITQSRKLAAFLKEIIINRRIFDYKRLSLV